MAVYELPWLQDLLLTLTGRVFLSLVSVRQDHCWPIYNKESPSTTGVDPSQHPPRTLHPTKCYSIRTKLLTSHGFTYSSQTTETTSPTRDLYATSGTGFPVFPFHCVTPTAWEFCNASAIISLRADISNWRGDDP